MKVLLFLAVGLVAGALATVGAALLGRGGAPATDRIVLELGDQGWSRSLAVHPGVPVTVTIINRSGTTHSFDAPALGIKQVIPAGTSMHPGTTTFTFTARKSGVFEWHCYAPCGETMGGLIYAPAGLKFNAGWVNAA